MPSLKSHEKQVVRISKEQLTKASIGHSAEYVFHHQQLFGDADWPAQTLAGVDKYQCGRSALESAFSLPEQK
jgi:hypothetical protein